MGFVTDGLKAIRSLSEKSESSAARVQAALTKVQDRTPWWASLLRWLGIGVSCAAVAFVLWRTGVLMLIGAGVTALVPRTIRSAARLEVKGASPEEITAVLRTDPKYEAARKAAKKEVQKKEIVR